MKKNIIPIAQAVLAFVLIGAIKIWAPVCPGLLDLANGNQAHMKCWFSSQAVMCVSIVIAAAAIVAVFMKGGCRRKIQIPIIIASILMILIFANIIGICMAPEMACHTTYTWVKIISVLIIVLGGVDIFTNKENQLPE